MAIRQDTIVAIRKNEAEKVLKIANVNGEKYSLCTYPADPLQVDPPILFCFKYYCITMKTVFRNVCLIFFSLWFILSIRSCYVLLVIWSDILWLCFSCRKSTWRTTNGDIILYVGEFISFFSCHYLGCFKVIIIASLVRCMRFVFVLLFLKKKISKINYTVLMNRYQWYQTIQLHV